MRESMRESIRERVWESVCEYKSVCVCLYICVCVYYAIVCYNFTINVEIKSFFFTDISFIILFLNILFCISLFSFTILCYLFNLYALMPSLSFISLWFVRSPIMACITNAILLMSSLCNLITFVESHLKLLATCIVIIIAN